MESKLNEFKVVTLCTSDTINKVLKYLPLWIEFLNPKSIVIIAPASVCKIVSEKNGYLNVECIDEDTIYPSLNFLDVKKKCVCWLETNCPLKNAQDGIISNF